MEKYVKAIVIILLLFLATNYIENYAIGYGLINPAVGGITLPIITAFIFVAIWMLLKKYGKIEAM